MKQSDNVSGQLNLTPVPQLWWITNETDRSICCGAFADGTLKCSFHGYLVQPPNCTISNAQTIEITFQDVLIDDINGSNYEQTVPYSITCDTAVRDPLMEMTLSWSGTPSDFDNAAVIVISLV